MKSIRNFITNILSAAVGGAGFIFFLFVLNTGFPVAIGVGAVSFIAASMILGQSETVKKLGSRQIALQIGDETISEAARKVDEIQALGRTIQDKVIGAKVASIIDLSERIFEDLKRDPRDVKPAKRFLTYYLDATVNILNKYQELAGTGLNTADVRTRMAKVGEILDTLQQAFEQQLNRLLDNDMIDLDSEISVLENTIKMEGLK